MTYFNTLSQFGDALKTSTRKAETHTQRVYQFFKDNPTRRYTPLMVHRLMNFKNPETSTRRAMSDLTKDDKLFRTDKKVPEKYGSPNYMWTLMKHEGQTSLFD